MNFELEGKKLLRRRGIKFQIIIDVEGITHFFILTASEKHGQNLVNHIQGIMNRFRSAWWMQEFIALLTYHRLVETKIVIRGKHANVKWTT